MPRKEQDNINDNSARIILLKDGPHRGRYITHKKPRKWYSIEIGDTDTYAYYVYDGELKSGSGKAKFILYLYRFQQIDGPNTSMANLRREWKRDGRKYDLEKV